MAAGIFFEIRRDDRISKCKLACDFEIKIVEANRNEQEATPVLRRGIANEVRSRERSEAIGLFQ